MRRVPPRPTSPEPVADKHNTDRRQGNARILVGTIIVIAVLHLARPVVVPVALAILFAFLLTPIVVRLERTFIRRSGTSEERREGKEGRPLGGPARDNQRRADGK